MSVRRRAGIVPAPRGAEAPRRGELLVGQLRRLLVLAEHRQGRRGEHPPFRGPAHAVGLDSPPAPPQVLEPLTNVALGDAEPPTRGQILAHEGAILRNAEQVAPLPQLGRGVQRTPLDVHHYRHCEQLHGGEMPFVDEEQAGLGLDLSVVEVPLLDGDYRALAVDKALAGGVTLLARALEGAFEHRRGEVVSLRHPERCQGEEGGVGPGGGGETRGERSFDFDHGLGRRIALEQALDGAMDSGHGLKAGVASRLLAKALQVPGQPAAKAGNDAHHAQLLGPQLQRALGSVQRSSCASAVRASMAISAPWPPDTAA